MRCKWDHPLTDLGLGIWLRLAGISSREYVLRVFLISQSAVVLLVLRCAGKLDESPYKWRKPSSHDNVSVTQTPQTKPIALDNFQLFGVRHLRELLAII